MKRKYKKSLVFVYAFVISIIILVASLFGGCLGVTHVTLPIEGNLFDKKVLEKYEMGWLERPKNVTNEKQYMIDIYFYVYDCVIDNIAEFNEYAEEVFTNFKEKNYTAAHFSSGDVYDGAYDIVEESDELFDFCKENGNQLKYTFYYSTKSKEDMKGNEKTGWKIGERKIIMFFYKDELENGKYRMAISLYGGTNGDSNLLR